MFVGLASILLTARNKQLCILSDEAPHRYIDSAAVSWQKKERVYRRESKGLCYFLIALLFEQLTH
jgi:hypothetical protein